MFQRCSKWPSFSMEVSDRYPNVTHGPNEAGRNRTSRGMHRMWRQRAIKVILVALVSGKTSAVTRSSHNSFVTRHPLRFPRRECSCQFDQSLGWPSQLNRPRKLDLPCYLPLMPDCATSRPGYGNHFWRMLRLEPDLIELLIVFFYRLLRLI